MPGTASRTCTRIFQTPGNDNKGGKLEDQQCESGAHRLKVRYHQTRLSQVGVYLFNAADSVMALKTLTMGWGDGWWPVAAGMLLL